jgi:glycosyltransferase involved in cell wall biosynthesis
VRSENGWQVPPDDLKALTNILRQALSDPVKLRLMGNASYRIVAEEINVEKMVEVFIEALNATCMIKTG